MDGSFYFQGCRWSHAFGADCIAAPAMSLKAGWLILLSVTSLKVGWLILLSGTSLVARLQRGLHRGTSNITESMKVGWLILLSVISLKVGWLILLSGMSLTVG